MKIVFLDAASIGDTPLDEIKELGEFICYDSSTVQEARDRVQDCEVLIVNKINVDKDLLSYAKKLKLLCVSATGLNNIDLEECERLGIEVKNVAAYSTNSVAQLTFTLLLSLVCDLQYFDSYVKSCNYSRSSLFTDLSRPFCELSGKTMGVIGMGAIGQKVAEIATSFGMSVIYFSTSGTSHCTKYPSVTLEKLLSDSDVLSIHAPLNDRTRNLLDSKELSLMKSTAVLLNLGRGGIINEVALAKALDEGTISAAALDVYEVEPLPESSPLLKLKYPERIKLCPHVGWASTASLKRLISAVANNIKTAKV